MAVSLKKGSSISLAKEAPGLSRVTMGLGWDPAKAKGLFGKFFGKGEAESIDLDASCLAFADTLLVETVWFRNLDGLSGAILHGGDNLTGEGDGDDEVIDIDLDRLPTSVDRLVLTVNSFRGQTFDEVENAFCRIVNRDDGRELARFTLSEKGRHTGVVMAILTCRGGEWSMKAVGKAADGRTASDMAEAAIASF